MNKATSILCGTMVVGTLDAIDALVVFGLRGSTPMQIFQGIASGWLGRASYRGGLSTALLGVLTHYFIAFAIVATYFFAIHVFGVGIPSALFAARVRSASPRSTT